MHRFSCGGRKGQALQQAPCASVRGQLLQRRGSHCNIFVFIFVGDKFSLFMQFTPILILHDSYTCSS